MSICQPLDSMLGWSALLFQACMRHNWEAKGTCILDGNETEHSSEKCELLLGCDGYLYTYNRAWT